MMGVDTGRKSTILQSSTSAKPADFFDFKQKEAKTLIAVFHSREQKGQLLYCFYIMPKVRCH